MTILHQCLGNVHSRETLKDDTAVSHTFARTTLCHCSHTLSVCDNATAWHLMDDISKQVHEDDDAHTAIHGPHSALERLRAMTWRVETLTILIHIFPQSLSALDLILADFPHRITKIEIGVLRGPF